MLFLVPEEVAGEHTLDFTIGDQAQSLSFTIEEYEPIADPKTYVHERTTGIKTLVEEQIDAIEDPQVQAIFEDQRNEIETALSDFGSMSDQQIRGIARFIKTNLLPFGSEEAKAKAITDIKTCDEIQAEIAPDMVILVGAVAGLAGATYVAKALSWTGWGTFGAALVGGISGGVFLVKLKATLELREDLVNVCFSPFESWIDEPLA